MKISNLSNDNQQTSQYRFIKSEQARNIITAAQFAGASYKPLNRFITINWGLYGISDGDASKCTTKYLKKIVNWLSNNSVNSAYVWVREKGETKGDHVHILIHVKPEIAYKLRAMNFKWLRSITGQAYKKGAVNSKIVGYGKYVPWVNPDAYDAHLKWLLNYMLKGVDDEVARSCSIIMSETSMPMTHKRCGYSQSLSSKHWPPDVNLDPFFLSDTQPPNQFIGQKFLAHRQKAMQLGSFDGVEWGASNGDSVLPKDEFNLPLYASQRGRDAPKDIVSRTVRH